MWKALRSDLAELVNTVAEESSSTIQKLDDHLNKIDDPQEGNVDSTYLGDDLYIAASANISGDLEDIRPSSQALDEADRRRCVASTYTDPLPTNVGIHYFYR